MGQLFYFVPELKTATAATIARLGLGYARDGYGPGYAAGTGPEGARGVFFTFQPGGAGGAANARWTPLRGVTQEDGSDLVAWVGVDPVSRPKPEDFARRQQQGGHWVELADGQRWLIPVARELDGSTPLPKQLTFTGKGWEQGEVVEAYRDLFGQACWFWDAMVGAGRSIAEGESVDVEVEQDDLYALAASAIAVNYTLGPNEIGALGLFTTETAREVMFATVDWPLVEDLKKKGLLGDLLDSAPGSAD